MVGKTKRRGEEGIREYEGGPEGEGKGGTLHFLLKVFALVLGPATCVFSIITSVSCDTFWNQRIHLILGITTDTKIKFNPYFFPFSLWNIRILGLGKYLNHRDISVYRGGPTLWGEGSLATPTKKIKIPLMPFEKKKKIIHGMALAKLSFKPPKKIFLLKLSPLKYFSLKIHKNSHDYASRPTIKSKNFIEIKKVQTNLENKMLKKVYSFTKLHTPCH